MLGSPGPMPAELAAEVTAAFDREELVELALGLGLFHGFSKMLIALGHEPDEMDTTILDTPAPTSATVTAGPADPRADVLAMRPDLQERWLAMAAALHGLPGLGDEHRALIDRRVATLVGAPWAAPIETSDEAQAVLAELAELFVIDVRALTPDRLDALRRVSGDDAVVPVIFELAVADGIARCAATIGSQVS